MLNLKDDRYFVVLKPQVLHNDEMIDVSLRYELTLQDLKDQLRGKYYEVLEFTCISGSAACPPP